MSTSLTAYAGLRYDDYSDGDSTLSPRFGAEYQHQRSGINLNVAWGEARKRPSFYALGDPLVGNPGLESEDSRGYEIRLESPLFDRDLTVWVFDYAYDNLIDFDFSTFSLVNRSSVEIDGVEIRIDSDTSQHWSWSVFASAQDILVNGARNGLLHRPEFSAGAIVSWTPNETWRLMMTASHEGVRRSSSIPGGETTLDSYARVNLAATRKLSKNVEIVLSVDNILGENYEVVTGFGSAGRQVRVSARFTL